MEINVNRNPLRTGKVFTMIRIFGLALLTGAMTALAMAQTAATTPQAGNAPAAGLHSPQISPEEKARNEAAYSAYLKAPDSEGTGPYPAIKEEDPSLPDHVVYRPKDISKVGKRQLGLIGWGNGACAADGAGSRFELAEIASHGYIVIAPGGIHSGPGSIPLPPPPPGATKFQMATSTADVKAGIDWALAENARPGSSYFGKIDPAQIGVAGFSCGGIHALEMAGDPRVKALIMQNSGMFPDDSKIFEGLKVNKATLQTLRTPVLYILGGPTDIAYENGMDDFKRINLVPVMVVSNNSGHGGDFIKPNGGPSAFVAAEWFDWQLRADKEAEKYFVGPDCGICKDPEWKVERKNFSTAQ
jgi:hypothetical protein